MRYPKILLCLLFLSMSLSCYAASSSLPQQRQTFQNALKAIQTNQINIYSALQQKLVDYPLSGYLEYRYLLHRLNHVSPRTISDFLEKEKNTFYADRLRNVWLRRLAKEGHWETFNKYYVDNGSNELACFYALALLKTKQTDAAYAEIKQLWLVPKSQPKACDTVFDAWKNAGKLTDDLIWERMLLALRDNQFSLAKYLAKQSQKSSQAQAWVSRWESIHHDPQKIFKQLPAKPPASKQTVSLAQDTELTREILIHGLERYARKDREKAFLTWNKLKSHYQFTEQEVFTAQEKLGLRAALNRDPKALKYYGSINGGEWHVRAALWQQDWATAKKLILGLPHELQTTTRWQYWLGRAQQALNDSAGAQETFSQLISERDYYAFMAADQLKQPYQMNHRPIITSTMELEAYRNTPEMLRLYEFYAQNMMLEARREAYYQRKTRSPAELQLMALLTHEWGWHNQTIATLGNAKYWDALDLRFPVVFDNEVIKASQTTGLDPSWLLAIARQESAFNPTARSHAGARGLMQLMPATGKLIAKLINKPLKDYNELYKSERNIELGSAYLKKVYTEHQRNPVLATASYNAGPHRVSRWLPPKNLAADIWAENIPFDETRLYVERVMSYAAIFDNQRNQPIKPLSQRMPTVKPQSP